MCIDTVPNRNSPSAILLRKSFRENGKVKKRTLANLSKLRADVIGNLRILLRGGEAVESFEDNRPDAAAFQSQVAKVRERFGMERVVWGGDRGMITDARIREELRDAEGLDWITALRAPQIRALVESGTFQLGLFNTWDMAEITHPDYPGERLIVCRNPRLAEQRVRNREDLLQATERDLEKVKVATSRSKGCLKGKDKIGVRVGKVIGRFKMAKHYEISIEEESFFYRRNASCVAQEAALDGGPREPHQCFEAGPGCHETVWATKSLSQVERAFRSLKSIDLKIRPIRHRLAERVRRLMSSFARRPTTWNGTCARPWPRSFSMITIGQMQPRAARARLPRPSAPKPPSGKQEAN